ncbi:MAG TPA: hypothetical protein GX510_00790 [Firmicutes bacterium]|nr:hypothetical protein [Candidatus Fermentithermobacillaceae bacterium]
MEKLADEADKIEGSHVDGIRPYLMNLEGRAANLCWDVVGRLAVGEEFKDRPSKPSLVLDMVEEFRAPVADRSITPGGLRAGRGPV